MRTLVVHLPDLPSVRYQRILNGSSYSPLPEVSTEFADADKPGGEDWPHRRGDILFTVLILPHHLVHGVGYLRPGVECFGRKAEGPFQGLHLERKEFSLVDPLAGQQLGCGRLPPSYLPEPAGRETFHAGGHCLD